MKRREMAVELCFKSPSIFIVYRALQHQNDEVRQQEQEIILSLLSYSETLRGAGRTRLEVLFANKQKWSICRQRRRVSSESDNWLRWARHKSNLNDVSDGKYFPKKVPKVAP